ELTERLRELAALADSVDRKVVLDGELVAGQGPPEICTASLAVSVLVRAAHRSGSSGSTCSRSMATRSSIGRIAIAARSWTGARLNARLPFGIMRRSRPRQPSRPVIEGGSRDRAVDMGHEARQESSSSCDGIAR